jgi:hypothetical protein
VSVDVRLDAVVLRALENEPKRRYQQVSEVKTAVETIVTSPPDARFSAGDTGTAAGASGTDQIRREVKGPAVGLVVTGILNLLLIPLAGWLCYQWAATTAVARNTPFWMLNVGLLLFGTALCNFMLHAGFKMIRLEARGAALAASVLAMLVPPGNLVGLPLGIWALGVLTRREVQAAFAIRKAETLPARPQVVWPWIGAAAGMVLLVSLIVIAIYCLT